MLTILSKSCATSVKVDETVTKKILSYEDLTSRGVERIARQYPSLTSVKFDLGNEIDESMWSPKDVQLRRLAKIPTLKCMDLTHCLLVTKKGVQDFSKNPGQITTLVLTGCTKVDNDFLKALSIFVNLGSLVLRGCRRISDKGVPHIAGLTSLTHLDLSPYVAVSLWDEEADDEEKVTDYSMEKLAALTNLTHLELEMCEQVHNSGLGLLKPLRNLTYLNVSKTGVSNSGLETILGFTNLKSLRLGSCNISDSPGIIQLAKMTSLTYLDLNNKEGISNSSWEKLAPLINLQRLDISFGGQMTDAGIPGLMKIPQLEWLDLGACTGITDKGVGELAKFSNLTRLSLNRCDQVTDEGIKQLSKLTKLKHLEVGTTGFRDVQVHGIRQLTFLTDITLHWVCARENNMLKELNDMGIKVHVV